MRLRYIGAMPGGARPRTGEAHSSARSPCAHSRPTHPPSTRRALTGHMIHPAAGARGIRRPVASDRMSIMHPIRGIAARIGGAASRADEYPHGEIFLPPSRCLYGQGSNFGSTVKPVARFTHAATAPRRAMHEEGPRPFRRAAPVPVNRMVRSRHVRITPGAFKAYPQEIACGAERRRTETRVSDPGGRYVGGPRSELRLDSGGPPFFSPLRLESSRSLPHHHA
jgi:hypothetical protein